MLVLPDISWADPHEEDQEDQQEEFPGEEWEIVPEYETVVEDENLPLSASHQHIDRQQIDRSRPTSTSEALELVTGLRVVQHGSEGKGHQIFLRGFDAAHGSDVEVLLEGISLNEPLNVHGHGYVDLYGVIPEVIGTLQVSKGPFLDIQGDFAMAGTVEIDLEVPAQLRPGFVQTGVSHRGWLRGLVVAAPREWSPQSFVAVETVYDAGFGPDRQARRAALVASYSTNVTADSELEFLAVGQTARFESPGAVRLSDAVDGEMGFYDTYGPAGAGISDRALLRVGWSRDDGDTDLDIFAYGMARRFSLEENFTGWLMDPEEGDRRNQAVDSGAVGAKVELEHRLPVSIPLNLRAGLGWRMDSAIQQERHVDRGGESIEGTRDLDATRHQVEARIGARISPVRWFEILPSVRLDLFNYSVDDRLFERAREETLFAVSPRVATAFPVHRTTTIFASYGRGFRSPEARSVTALSAGTAEDVALSAYAGGDPDVSICDATELGLTVAPADFLSMGLAGFATWIEREMVFDHVSNLNLEKNATRRAGVEASLGIEPLPWLDIDADLTFVDARFVDSGAPVPGSARWQGTAKAFAGLDLGPKGGVQVEWVSPRALAHGATVEGYATLNLIAGWRFEHFDVTLMVENATASRNMEGAYHYASWFDRESPRSAIPAIHYVAARPLTARLMLTAFL